ncbi:MAG: amidohydrolase family protein [Candidatus Omnitrophica bacterium]|nr:amidohydrolase family protein [Candidatus Omnitrophota bacterium]
MIDGHCHLDKTKGDCRRAMDFLYREAKKNKVEGIILLNIPDIAFSNEEVLTAAEVYDGFFRVFPSPELKKSSLKTIGELKKKGATGIKLHPRLAQRRMDDPLYISFIKKAADLNMPVLIDCFPDGKNIALGNVPEKIAVLAEKIPHARIAIGHAGGHKILDALMVAKFYKNIYLDLSYTLLYYRSSDVIQNLLYAIKSIKAERVFWGTDYPDRPYSMTVKLSVAELAKMKLCQEWKKKILEDNVRKFLDE